MGPDNVPEIKNIYVIDTESGAIISEIKDAKLISEIKDTNLLPEIIPFYEVRPILEFEIECREFKRFVRQIRMIQRWECRARQYQRKAAKIEKKKSHSK